MVSVQELRLQDGRVVRVHDSADGSTADTFTVLWHHGSPQTGSPLAPLLAAAAERGIRLLSYGRPSYGGSSPRPGRNVASAAADVARIADAFDFARFAVMGASGGGPHALACAARLPARVTGVACLASPAPFDADGLDFFGGMAHHPSGHHGVPSPPAPGSWRHGHARRGDGHGTSTGARPRSRHSCGTGTVATMAGAGARLTVGA